MDRLDSEAIGWLAQFRRVSSPYRVVWIQDDVLHTRKYNLEVTDPKPGFHIEEGVNRENKIIYITTDHYTEVTIWLDDFMVDLEKPVTVIFNDQVVFNGQVYREECNIIESINGRFDPEYLFGARSQCHETQFINRVTGKNTCCSLDIAAQWYANNNVR